MRFAIYCIIPIVLQVLGCCEFCTAAVSSHRLSSHFPSKKDTNAVATLSSVHVPGEWPLKAQSPHVQQYQRQTSALQGRQLQERQRFADRARHSWSQHFSRQRPADRRIFFSFNQMLLSMIAPRLMRYQFDLMMHSVVAELFRKILVPAAGFSGDSNSLFSSIGNLLRFRGQTAPRTTTAAPSVDVQRLLDNAHKLIALQGLMHKPVDHSSQHNSQNNSPTSAVVAQEHLANSNVNHQSSKQPLPHTVGRGHLTTDTQIDRSRNQTSASQQSKANTKSDHPIQLAISTKDIISFLQNNFKQHQSVANYNSTAVNTAKNTAFQQDETSSNINHLMQSTSFGRSHTDLASDGAKTKVDNFLGESPIKSPFAPRQRTRGLENFKMSHLTFIDTEVPNYGNQLLVRDQSESGVPREGASSPSATDPNRSQVGLIDPSLLNEKDFHSFKNDDLERANRWNDVLVNMNEAQNG